VKVEIEEAFFLQKKKIGRQELTYTGVCCSHESRLRTMIRNFCAQDVCYKDSNYHKLWLSGRSEDFFLIDFGQVGQEAAAL